MANRGTVLIDEVGDLSLAVQAKIHRTLESHQYLRVGDSVAQSLLCRLVFSTHRDLDQLVQDGEIREDLYSHLNVFKITLPPLRNRREDIESLVNAFLAKHHQTRRLSVSDKAMRELSSRSWPGNVRELKFAIDHAALVATGSMIEVEDLPAEATSKNVSQMNATTRKKLEELVKLWSQTHLDAIAPDSDRLPSDEYLGTLLDDLLAVVEPPLIRSVLEHYKGNRAAAAVQLGLHRSTLRQKMRRYDMES